MYGYGYDNPYMQGINPYIQQPMQTAQPQAPRQEIVKVNGENGANAINLGANSSLLALDMSGLIVWLITTDGAGYKTVEPYDITPHRAQPAPDYNSLEERIRRLEEMMSNGNASDITAAKSAHTGRKSSTDKADV